MAMALPLGATMAMRVHAALGEAIVAGTYDAAPLPSESELCRQFGASRTVVREAIKLLTAKGLIFTRQRAGTRINPVADWNLLDPEVIGWLARRPASPRIRLEFQQMRLAIEPVAAALAAQCDDAGLLQDIERHHAELARSASEPERREAEVAFHIAILRASGNDVFWRLRALVGAALDMSAGCPDPDRHQALLEAILGRRPADAEREARRLLEEAIAQAPLKARASPEIHPVTS